MDVSGQLHPQERETYCLLSFMYNWSWFSDIEKEKTFTPFSESNPFCLTAADDVKNGNQTGKCITRIKQATRCSKQS
jgi:hypothetical protein